MILFFLIGCFVGLSLFLVLHRIKTGGFQSIAREIIQKAELEAETKQRIFLLSLKDKEYEKKHQLNQIEEVALKKIAKEKERISHREDQLDARIVFIEKAFSEIEKNEKEFSSKKELLEKENIELVSLKLHFESELEKLSSMTKSEGKELLLETLKNELKKESANYIIKCKKQSEEEAELDAKRILATTLNRIAAPSLSEIATITVTLPNEEMKGRIIGREGRNIRVLEQASGVNFLIDETPNAIVISGFDPIRKHIAKLSLQKLFKDGRIHPSRIEEVVLEAENEISKSIQDHGKDAAWRMGFCDLHPELISLLGKLSFRTSFGQNILDHSIEVSRIMGLIASELKLDEKFAQRIGLLHDIGKAVSHDQEGSHALIGYDLALKYGEKEEVAIGIGCHHGEMLATTIEASLCSAADAISGARTGARLESIENYFKRLKKLESISKQFEGVEKAYALQAGREIRVIVEPEKIDDASAAHLARNIAKRIEKEMSYPGKIKVTVIREKRVVDYAI